MASTYLNTSEYGKARVKKHYNIQEKKRNRINDSLQKRQQQDHGHRQIFNTEVICGYINLLSNSCKKSAAISEVTSTQLN